nr:sulfate transporter isoform X2 [Columba livia]
MGSQPPAQAQNRVSGRCCLSARCLSCSRQQWHTQQSLRDHIGGKEEVETELCLAGCTFTGWGEIKGPVLGWVTQVCSQGKEHADQKEGKGNSSPGAMEDTSSHKSGQSEEVQSSPTPEEGPANFIHVQLEEYEPADFSTKDLILKKAREILLGILQLGFVAVYLSEPLLSGFVAGSSLTIITSQMKYLLGLKIPRHEGVGSFILTWVDLFRYIQGTNICDLVTSLVALAIIVPVKEINDRYKEKMKAPFPIELLVVIVATVTSYYFNFEERYKSAVCGHIPTGFSKPTLPDINLFSSLAVDALPIAVIGFAMTISLAEIFGKKHGYTVRANQEMIAIGMCNLVPSFFYCFASSAALTKTLLKESTGTQTQVSGLVTSLVLLLVLLWVAPLFYSLQTSILGVVTIVNLRGGLRKFHDTPRMWQLSKLDTVVWWTTMLSSTLITTEIGLLVGVCFALLCVIFRTQRPRATLLGKVSNTEIYEDRSTYKQLSSIANIKIFRFESSLYYANKDYFKTVLYQKTGVNPVLLAAKHQMVGARANADTGNNKSFFGTRFGCLKPAKKRTEKPPADASPPSIDMHTLILDCGAMQFIDTVGLSVLKEIHHDYKEIGVQVLLANCNPSIRHQLRDGGWAGRTDSGGQLAFYSVHDAVQFAEQCYNEQQDSKEKKDALLDPEDLDFQVSL